VTTAAHAGKARRIVSTRLPTKWAVFQAIAFEREIFDGDRSIETAVVLALGDPTDGTPLVRIHSQCFTGDVLGSMRCDCGEQLEMALQAIASEERGLVIYEHQEGRGIGLMAKLQAYALQDRGLDTLEANDVLGFSPDYRDYGLPIAILRELGVERVRLLSNNPDKARALSEAGIAVVAQVSCEVAPNQHSFAYLRAKKEKMGHALSLGPRHDPEDQEGGEGCEFASIDDALNQLRAGRMVVVVDDDDRENEGDLMIAAETITPEAVICEILNDDGTMARVPDLIRFCNRHNLVMITVADLARYRFELDCEEALGPIDGVPVSSSDSEPTEFSPVPPVAGGPSAVNAELRL
jgi:GTP cyclohydrolase II